MATKTDNKPVVETARLLGIKYSVPNPPKGNGYNVLSLEKDNERCIALQPYEEWKDPEKIELLFGSDVVLSKNVFGKLRVHENMQKEILKEVNSFKKHLTDLSDTDEILAMGIEDSNQGIGENAEKLQELKNFILEILNRVDAIEKSIILTDQDLFNLKQVLIYSHTNSHAIPKD